MESPNPGQPPAPRVEDQRYPTTEEVAVQILNEFFKLDPAACNKLLQTRVECSQTLADHKDIVVDAVNGKNKVGLLGVLNGILTRNNGKRIAMMLDGDKVVGFTFYTPPK